MQNDLKYGKLSEIFGINVYFMGKTRKKSRLRRKKREFTHIIKGEGGGEEFNL